MQTPPTDLVSTTEATEILGYKNVSSVARLVYEHKLTPAMRLKTGKQGAYLFHRSDIEALRDERAS